MYFYLTYNSMNISYIIVLILIIINHNTNNIYENIKYIKYRIINYFYLLFSYNSLNANINNH